MDTKFSVAVHILILISESPSPINSDQMAESVGTNASYIRKILALLKKADIVDGHRGVSGYGMTVSPITFLEHSRQKFRKKYIFPWENRKNGPEIPGWLR